MVNGSLQKYLEQNGSGDHIAISHTDIKRTTATQKPKPTHTVVEPDHLNQFISSLMYHENAMFTDSVKTVSSQWVNKLMQEKIKWS